VVVVVVGRKRVAAQRKKLEVCLLEVCLLLGARMSLRIEQSF
jgi:hypothetical protein